MNQQRDYLKRVTVENRILLLLRDHINEQDDYSVSEVLSQGGMSEKLLVRQNNLSRELQSLSTRGYVQTRSAHVNGLQRRRKVYFLSPEGHERSHDIANELRKLYVVVKERDGSQHEWQLGRLQDHLSESMHRRVGLHEVVEELLEEGEADLGKLLDGEVRHQASSDPIVKEFYGREGELGIMKAAFLAKGPVILSIISIAGQGKTTLASFFISSEHLNCTWIKVNRWLTPQKLFSDLMSRIGEPGHRGTMDHGSDPIREPVRMVDALIDGMARTGSVLVLDDSHLLDKDTVTILRLFRERSLSRKVPLRTILTSRERPRIYSRTEAQLKKDIVEIQLDGLDKGSVSRFLLSKGIPQPLHEDYYRRTMGHPLTIALLALRPETGPKEAGIAVGRLMEDEVLSNLAREELTIMEFLSIMDIPVEKELLYSLPGITREIVLGVLSKLLIREYNDGTVDLHDLLKETVRPTISRDRSDIYKRTAFKHFSRRGRDIDLVQTMHFAMELGMTEVVVRLISDHGEYLLGRGYPQVIDALDRMSIDIDDPATRVRMLLIRSDSERLRGGVENAVRFLDEASDLAMTIKGRKGVNSQPFLQSKVLRRYAEVKELEGSGKEVLELYLRSLALVESSGEKEETARVYSDTGMAYLGMREFERSITNLRKALEIYNELGLERGLAQSRTDLGIVYFRKLELANSLRELLQSARISRECGFERTRYMAHYWTGRLYMTVMQPEEAVYYYRSSMMGFGKMGDPKNCSRALIGFVSSCLKSGERRKAERSISRLKRELMGGMKAFLPWARIDISSEVMVVCSHLDLFEAVLKRRKDLLSRNAGPHFDHLRTEYEGGALIDAVSNFSWALSPDFKGPNMDYLDVIEKEAMRMNDITSRIAVLYARATSTEIDDDEMRSNIRKALSLCIDGFEEERKKLVQYLSLRSGKL
ncbi:MAG: tetratricopeptide repeat protein [Candidatus Thermoplasmatota archaeon]|nr:tetratricopeptide repeat protein [Candidatus Thermoplasmatota archaeon]